VSLDGCLSAEGADVFGVLSDFHLLDLLSQRRTVSVNRENQLSAMCSNSILQQMCIVRTSMAPQAEEIANFSLENAFRHSSVMEERKNVPCTVLAGNSDLLGSLRHLGCCCVDER
jgi:hypothetical protein